METYIFLPGNMSLELRQSEKQHNVQLESEILLPSVHERPQVTLEGC